MKTITVLLLLLWLSASGAAFIYGQQVPFAEQWPLFEALRTTSAIIFAVVGAWLAIVYPERLRLSFDKKSEAAKANGSGNIAILLSPVVNSTVILCILLLVGILAPLLKRSDFLLTNMDFFRGVSYSLLVALTLWQAWTVILTLIPADMILTRASEEDKRAKVIEGLGKASIKSSTKTDS
jgi:hypothetical protein